MAIAIPLVFGIAGQFVGGALLGVSTFGIAGFGATLGGMAGAYLGSLMFPQKAPDQSLPKLGSYQTQTTLSGAAIPVIYGTYRVAGNVIILGDSHPYTVKHKASGGKGTFGSRPSVKETRYRRSFLIGICEGPATVKRVWCGKEEISVDDMVIFEGDGNAGLANILGKEFAHYKNLCCAWFEEYELGNYDSVPSFTFEVRGGKGGFPFGDIFVGSSYSAGEGQSLWIIESDGTVKDYGGPTGTDVKAICLLPNGDYLVGTSSSKVIKYKSDGNGDKVTSFANNGEYDTRGEVLSITIDPDENIIIGCKTPKTEPCVAKLDSGGNLIWENLVPSDYFDNVAYDVVCDSNGDVYVAHNKELLGLNYSASKLSKTDGSRLVAYNSPNQIASYSTGIAVDDFGFVYISSWKWSGSGGGNHSLWRNSNDNSQNWGVTFPDTNNAYNAIIVQSGETAEDTKVFACALNKYIYPPGYYCDKSVRKMNYDLSVEEACYGAGATDLRSICVTEDDDIVVAGTYYSGGSKHIVKLDSDLNEIAQYSVGDDAVHCYVGRIIPPWGGELAEDDINPVDAIYDLLTNARYGAGISASFINDASFDAVKGHCNNNNLLFSFALDNQQPFLDWLDYIQSHYCGFTKLG